MGVFDFKAIKRKLDCQEQKADFEEKNPAPPAWYSQPTYWTPDGGYGATVPLAHVVSVLSEPVMKPAFYGAVPYCVAVEEGGEWFPYNAAYHGEGALIHSAKFADGREWDAINGWRELKI